MRATDRRRLAVLGASLVGVAALAACGDDTGPVLDERPASVTGHELEVRVPSAEIAFTVGDPESSVDDVDAPDGHVIVPIAWSVTRQPAGPFSGLTGETQVEVVAGEDTVPLTTIDDRSGADESAYVVLPGEGTDVDLRVTYDGVTQTVTTDGEPDHGAAAPYYESTGEGVDLPCGPSVWGRADIELACSARGWVLPYVPDEGWAPEGSAFVVVEPRLVLQRVVDGRQRSAVAFRADRSTIDGVQPQIRLDPGTEGEGSADGLVLAEVDAGGTHVWEPVLEFEVTEGPRSGSTVRLTARLPLR